MHIAPALAKVEARAKRQMNHRLPGQFATAPCALDRGQSVCGTLRVEQRKPAMKPLILALLLILMAAPALAETITPPEAKNHIGQNFNYLGEINQFFIVQKSIFFKITTSTTTTIDREVT